MDELTLIRGFGLSERVASQAERDRVRAGLLAHVERGSHARAGRRRWVMALATALLLLLAGTALALGPLRGVFEGAPAPPKVKRSIAGYNDFHEQLLRTGLGGFVVRSEDATGLIRFRVGKLPVRVWTAPLVGGGSCTFVDTESEHGLAMGPCSAPVNVQPPVLYGMSERPGLGLVVGHVTGVVTRLDVRLGSGTIRHLRLVNGFFATGFASGSVLSARENRENNALIAHQQRETRRSALPAKKLNAHQAAEWDALKRRQAARHTAVRPIALNAYDAAGHRIANIELPANPPEGNAFAQAFFYKGMRAMLQINTQSGAPAALVLGADTSCDTTSFAGGGSTACGSSGSGESWQQSSATVGRWLVLGHVGDGAAAAEIQFGNGKHQPLELLEGRFLVELTDEQVARVPHLIVRDASGKIIRTRALVSPKRP
jgi:hypothetical protein